MTELRTLASSGLGIVFRALMVWSVCRVLTGARDQWPYPGEVPTGVYRLDRSESSRPWGARRLVLSCRRPIEEPIVSKDVMTPTIRSAGVPPNWTSVLAVISHPDDESFGLGTILDAFVFAGAKVQVLCLTHGQTWTLDSAPGDLAALRGAGLASAADVLGPTRVSLPVIPDGALSELDRKSLAEEVVIAAEACGAEGLLVFDTA